MVPEEGQVIGYSGLWLSEECYEYHENACYIADTKASAKAFMEMLHPPGTYRIDPVTLRRIMNDYGCSCGEFAMEEGAFVRFKAAAKTASISFESRIEQCDIPLAIVRVAGVSSAGRSSVALLARWCPLQLTPCWQRGKMSRAEHRHVAGSGASPVRRRLHRLRMPLLHLVERLHRFLSFEMRGLKLEAGDE